MLEAAVKTKDKAKRIKLYEECDQYLMEKSPVIPIYSDDYIVMMNLRVRDFQTSPMGTLDLSKVYIKELKN
jgi:ABC-type transport system substrate-binding protein